MKPAIFALALALAAWSSPATSDQHLAPSPSSVLKTLHAGNQRYVHHKIVHPHQSRLLRQRLVAGQHPVAAILSCADSRVPPELVFDQGLGDLFTVRVAGNVVDDAILGSLEYAVEHLHVPVILVLGHIGCGAVQATIAGGEPNTHIDSLVKAIRPAVEQASHEAGVLMDNAVRDNVQLAVKQLQDANPILAMMSAQGKIQIKGAVYHMDTGVVEFLK
ncbi:MAG TPA: carbonic anhydrase [Bryobacteraceae bacterium]|nr:carbonic anhydrase [Bryobacteraceae bacterium]